MLHLQLNEIGELGDTTLLFPEHHLSHAASAFYPSNFESAAVVTVETSEDQTAKVTVTEDQQSLAIGKGGQNVRLAAKLTGWKIDITALEGEKTEEIKQEIMEWEKK